MNANELFDKLKHIKVGGSTCLYSIERCKELIPLINKINRLKKEKNALILSHSYVSPEILYGVTDGMGDSYELSKKAKETNASIIVFTAVKFMAETAKILNPRKRVIFPNINAGCSLADSVPQDIFNDWINLHSDHTVISYINCSAEVKAMSDIICTSSNENTKS